MPPPAAVGISRRKQTARNPRLVRGERADYDAWLPYQGAGTCYVHVEYIPDQHEDGRVAGLYVLVSDLTERRRTEEAIERLHAENRAQLAEMEALFEAAPVGIFLARDRDCRNMVMNRAGAEMLRVAGQTNPSLSGPDTGAAAVSGVPRRPRAHGRRAADAGCGTPGRAGAGLRGGAALRRRRGQDPDDLRRPAAQRRG